jgi:hypothetical protein
MAKGSWIRSKEDAIERFWSKVEKTDGCWIWTAHKSKDGYGQYTMATKYGLCDSDRAHRIAYNLTFDDYDSSLEVCHKCDNPECVRPDHLFLGTMSDNRQDCANKGRLHFQTNPFKGEKHGRAKLDWNTVREIRRLHEEEGIPQVKLVEMFGVGKSAISAIIRKENWVE